MKTIYAALIITTCLIAMSLKQDTPVKKNLASVKQSQGIYIFMQSEPVAEYEVLGTVKKTGIVWSGKPEEMFNTILRRAQKDYPRCDGLIFDAVDMEHATCIKFK